MYIFSKSNSKATHNATYKSINAMQTLLANVLSRESRVHTLNMQKFKLITFQGGYAVVGIL